MVPITMQFPWLQVIDGKIEYARLGRQPFMEMVSKQFFPFMETVVQPCLTDCATASYRLCNCVLQFMGMVGKQFFPFMETVLEVVPAKISGYIKS